jgi:signal transduction histidine kinase
VSLAGGTLSIESGAQGTFLRARLPARHRDAVPTLAEP